MARFPHYRKNIVALGRLLAQARLDPRLREALKNSPEQELARIGLPENVTRLITFRIIDSPDQRSVALPFKLDDKLLRDGNAAYLTSIANSFSHPI